jgi:hypothetical protein
MLRKSLADLLLFSRLFFPDFDLLEDLEFEGGA